MTREELEELIFRLEDQASPRPTAVGLTLPSLLSDAASAIRALLDEREASRKAMEAAHDYLTSDWFPHKSRKGNKRSDVAAKLSKEAT